MATKKQVFEIHDRLTDLNTYIDAERKHRMIAARIKKSETEYCTYEIAAGQPAPMKSPVTIHYTWYVPSYRPDPDNIAFAKKFINDALEQMRVIERDNLKNVVGLSDSFVVTKERKGVTVVLTSVDDGV